MSSKQSAGRGPKAAKLALGQVPAIGSWDLLTASNEPIRVVDGNGRVVGHLTRELSGSARLTPGNQHPFLRSFWPTPSSNIFTHEIEKDVRKTRVLHAMSFVLHNHMVETGKKQSLKKKTVSARIPRPLLEAAQEATGIKNVTDLMTAALASVVTPNFGEWLVANAGTLPKDFELDV
jgi:hypothetical protein